MKVTVLDDYQRAFEGTEAIQRLRKKLDVQILTEKLSTEEALIHALKGVQAIIPIRERTKFPAALLQSLTDLEFISQTGNHAYHVDIAAATKAGIVVAMAPGSNSTAELAFGLMLAVMRRIPRSDQAMRRGDWALVLGYVLRGKTLGILGLGKIGTEVAQIGRAFGMKVVAWSQNLEPDVAKKAHAKPVSKEELFSSSDVVTVHYKLSPRSAGLVGVAELALMKPSAYLVNTSRGPLVDSAALLAALRSGSIAGAALDVYDVEPLPLSDRLRSAPNVVLTPHLGYVTEETYRVFYGDAAEDIVAFAQGSPVRVLTASLWCAGRLPVGVAAGQGEGALEGRCVLGRFDGVGEALVLAEEFGLGLDDVL